MAFIYSIICFGSSLRISAQFFISQHKLGYAVIKQPPNLLRLQFSSVQLLSRVLLFVTP